MRSDAALKYGYDDGLDYTLPEFSRTAWVSQKAEAIWRPRFTSIREAWSRIQVLSVRRNARSCALVRMRESDLLKQARDWLKDGLDVLPLQMEAATSLPYRSTVKPFEPGKPSVVCVAIGRPAELATIGGAWKVHDHEIIGTLLGYPDCCRRFFQDTWVRQRSTDTTWTMARNSQPDSDTKTLSIDGLTGCNILLRWIGVRGVPHLPCSFCCSQTEALYQNLTNIGREAGFENEMSWMDEALSWPAEWSVLHGIAEIKTPVLKVVTRSDATATKYVVRWLGKLYPAEGGRGVAFPYAANTKASVSSSKSYNRGLANSVSVQEVQPDWYHYDNGFESRFRMDRSHRPIVAAAIQVLGERAGKVLDLGCGNGALLGKIVCGRSQLTAVGIDLNPDAIEHASLLQCGSASIFKTGNFFDCRLWTSSGNYALALLMIGRLLEASPDQSAALIKAIKGSCRDLLVYVYPGWSDQTFLELVERAGLKLSSAPYPNVGLVELNHNSFHLCGSLGDNLKT